jgi:hypothetical protein
VLTQIDQNPVLRAVLDEEDRLSELMYNQSSPSVRYKWPLKCWSLSGVLMYKPVPLVEDFFIEIRTIQVKEIAREHTVHLSSFNVGAILSMHTVYYHLDEPGDVSVVHLFNKQAVTEGSAWHCSKLMLLYYMYQDYACKLSDAQFRRLPPATTTLPVFVDSRYGYSYTLGYRHLAPPSPLFMYCLDQCMSSHMFGHVEVELHRCYYDNEMHEKLFVIIPALAQYFLMPTTQEIYNLKKLMSVEINCTVTNGCSGHRNWPVHKLDVNISHTDPVLLRQLAEAEIRWLDAMEVCAAVVFLLTACVTLWSFKTALRAVGILADRLFRQNTDPVEVIENLNDEHACMMWCPVTGNFDVYVIGRD